VTLSQGFNLRISSPVACQLLSVLALTQIGLSPISNLRLAGHAEKQKRLASQHLVGETNLLIYSR
ncbi:hypothetical protein, partial [Metabacillus litoralis]|uniref:hypothetical protein n=1 Tax=Metabacillus litoralis TaxID=152268 RepID=UPI00203A9FB9